MNAADQLSMFEPDAVDASRLLQGYMKDAERFAAAADRFDLLQMPGAAAQADRSLAASVECAQALAFYLDLLEVSGV